MPNLKVCKVMRQECWARWMKIFNKYFVPLKRAHAADGGADAGRRRRWRHGVPH